LGSRHRTVDQRNLDSVAEGRQRRLQNVGHPGRLNNQGLEFCEHGTFRIGLEVDLLTLDSAPNDSRCRQGLQFPLNGAVTASRHSHYLTEVEPLVRMAIQQAQNRSSVLGKEDFGQRTCSK
jgi:hypothetical protein